MKLLIYGCLIISLGACSTTKNSAHTSIESYLENLQGAILNHNVENFMGLVDADYVKEQHDGMLEGRTAQFVNELFCGSDTYTAEFKCLRFASISNIENQKLLQEGLGYRVFYLVSAGEDSVVVDWIINIRRNENGQIFGIVGGVG